ncbi:aminopeptidase P family protein [Spiroplasma tabanidicola]|uniref:Xaa-Pro dipeptidase n=1 Tax=Spiroplasma tabanidicola TaxID=324079 RepID=A0A6I6CCU9_9MOLU|nr:aminopeptidase P family protein [Spiroplasma tabanidicola]QGS52118.1 Xaa-Pro dipeptidase [Spiroplasma tabanidicola]
MKKELLNKILEETNSDAILLYSPQNRYWFSRFPSSLGYLLYTKQKSYLYLDGRYITAARESEMLINIDELETYRNVFDLLNKKIKENNVKKLLIESDWVYLNEAEIFKKRLEAEVEGYNFSRVRMVKDEWEVAQVRKACDITHQVFLDVLEFVKPGMKETDLARFVSDSFLKHGAQKLSFDTIVASGENGSKPHAVPSERVLKEGDFVTLDMGCYFNGYASDQTRTFALGNDNNAKLKEIYDIVYNSQQAGIDAIKPGVLGAEIHKICFDYIENKGYGEYFTHGTGHGLGIEIHEAPNNSSADKTPLAPGMCVTVEPGIYIPGIGGVRIEDDILVTEEGHDYLTTPLRELQIVKNK